MVQFFIDNAEVYFDEKFSKSKVMLKELDDAFIKLFGKNRHLLPDRLTQRHGINPLFVMAMEETLTDKISTVDDLKEHVMVVYKYIMKSYLEMQRSRYLKTQDKWDLFLTEAKHGNDELYDNDYFKLVVVNENGNSYGFDLHQCFYYDIFVANDKEYLGPILCDFDYLLADNLNRWIVFDRDKTIAGGYQTCNFRFQAFPEAFSVPIEVPQKQITSQIILKCVVCNETQLPDWELTKQISSDDPTQNLPFHCDKEMGLTIQEK
ncbi:MAG: L-2-amino-thiazoline-4-carboxylic acid hydrolase [Candidatus Kariarchaeaceae archaeon]|jgi:hypothetical protein